MKSSTAIATIKIIEDTISDIKNIESSGTSMINSSYLAKFLVVCISGLYEKMVKGILADMAISRGDNDFANFITGYRWYSPTFENIVSLLNQFNKNWSVSLKLIDIKYRDAITSIANNKNQIAHGSATSLTLNDVYNYYYDSKIVIEEIDKLLLGI